jgi:hypothetical protein
MKGSERTPNHLRAFKGARGTRIDGLTSGQPEGWWPSRALEWFGCASSQNGLIEIPRLGESAQGLALAAFLAKVAA